MDGFRETKTGESFVLKAAEGSDTLDLWSAEAQVIEQQLDGELDIKHSVSSIQMKSWKTTHKAVMLPVRLSKSHQLRIRLTKVGDRTEDRIKKG